MQKFTRHQKIWNNFYLIKTTQECGRKKISLVCVWLFVREHTRVNTSVCRFACGRSKYENNKRMYQSEHASCLYCVLFHLFVLKITSTPSHINIIYMAKDSFDTSILCWDTSLASQQLSTMACQPSWLQTLVMYSVLLSTNFTNESLYLWVG